MLYIGCDRQIITLVAFCPLAAHQWRLADVFNGHIRPCRPLQPTALGRQLAIHGKAILAASRKATETVSSFRGATSGRVRIGGVPFFMDAIVSSIIAKFQVNHPDIGFDQSYSHFRSTDMEPSALQKV